MDKEQIKKLIVEVFKEQLAKTQYDLSPVPFHTHNNIDSTNFPFINLSDVPKTYKGQAGKSLTVKTNESGLEFNSGGGGGSPGGNDTNVQFNDSGSFGGEDTFNFDKTTTTLTLDIGTDVGTTSTLSGGISDFLIKTDDKAASNNQTGAISIYVGSSTAGTGQNVYGGNAILASGGGSSHTAGNGLHGNVYLLPYGILNSPPGGPSPGGGNIIGVAPDKANGIPPGGVYFQSGGNGAAQAASITVNPASVAISPYSASQGDIVLFTGLNSTRGNVQIPTGNVIVGDSSTTTSTNVQKALILFNTTAPSGSTTGAGILYVESGALKYRGAGGTVTTLANS